ncbi:MAG: class I SAM-dependent methyltransferase [Sphingomonadales bacterium]
MSQKEWFASWFDSPYYHLLYQHRDDNEAKQFIGHLIEVLHLPQGVKVLDLACGKGRHSITLAQMGYNVTGADLAANSIASAEQSSAALPFNDLRFLVHDMRQPIPGATFKAVFNLFTSFGYFDTLQENQAVCAAIAQMLEPNGLLIIDFLNANKVISNLVKEDTVQRDDLTFSIERWNDETHIYKKIKILDRKNDAEIGTFVERVQALRLADFQALLATHFDVVDSYGSYDLAPFDAASSDRLILIAKKKA